MEHDTSATRGTGLAYAVGSGLCFGSMAIFARMAYASGVDIPSLLLLRFTFAATLLWIWVLMKGVRLPRGRSFPILVLMGTLGYAGQAFCYFSALTHASAGLVALLLYTYPAIVAVLSWLVFRQRLSRKQGLALVITSAGSILVIGKAIDGSPLGIFFGLLAAFVYSIYILTGSRLPKDVTPLTSTTIITSAAAVSYAIIASAKGLHLPATVTGWFAVAAIALVSTVLAILFFFEGLERVGPVRASVFSTVEPVFTVLLAALLLDETITLARVVGGALILGAVILLANEHRGG